MLNCKKLNFILSRFLSIFFFQKMSKPKRKVVRKKWTYAAVEAYFREHGCALLSEEEDFVNTKSKIQWRCGCGNVQTSSFTRQTRCRACGIKQGKGRQAVTAQIFAALLEKSGWKLLDLPVKYKNTKTLMRVQTNQDIECTTSYNRFRAGHRDKASADNTFRKRENDVIAEFQRKGLLLLDSYTNNKIPMKYRCRCGKISVISLVNLRKNKTGCNACAIAERRLAWDEVQQFFEQKACVLRSPEGDYINNTSPLSFTCACGEEGTTSFKSFRRGVRCVPCGEARRAATNVELYGAANVFASAEIKKKIRAYYQRVHGVDHNMQLEECKEKVRQTSLKKFGATNVMKTHEGLRRHHAALGRDVIYTFPRGRQVAVQGYEPFCIDLLLKEYDEDDLRFGAEIEGSPFHYTHPETERDSCYFPDMYVVSTRTVVEVKSPYFYDLEKDKNLAKWRAVKERGYNMKVYVFIGNKLQRIEGY